MDSSIGVIILAGGNSRRMGFDKGMIAVNQKPIIQYILETCQAISNNILIVSSHEPYNQFGYPVIIDIIPNKGPLGGLHSGLVNSNCEYNIVLSCDVPLVSIELLSLLISKKEDSKLAIIAKYQNQVHPLIGLYRKNCINTIEDLIAQKKYRMSDLYNQNETTILDLTHFPEKEFLNLNTEKELTIFKALLNDS